MHDMQGETSHVLESVIMSESPIGHRITAVFEKLPDAAAAYIWLHQHFDKNHIFVLLSEQVQHPFNEAIRESLNQTDIQSSPESEVSAASGVVIGAGAFVLAGLALSGTGLLAAGPLTAALVGGAGGAIFGGMIGGLVGFGFPSASAHAYEALLKEGHIALAVRVHDQQQIKLVIEAFRNRNGEHIMTI